MSIWSRIERRLTDLAEELLPDEFRHQIDSARQLLDQGRHAEAAETLEGLVGERPDHAAALTLLGVARLELGEPADALAAFDRALAQDDALAAAYLGRGQANLELDRLDPAKSSFRAAVRLAGGDRDILADAYRGLGLTYRRRGDLDKAVRELRKAIAENPTDAIALAALGDALLLLEYGAPEEAQRYLDRAVDSGEAPATAWLALGRIALEERRAEAAREQFTRALDSALADTPPATGDQLDALIGLGDAALLTGDTTSAHQHYLRALEIDPRRAAIHYRIGDVHRQIDDLEAALASYRRAVDLVEEPAILRRALDTALHADAIDAAVDLANRMLAIDPGDPHAMVARGTALARDRQIDAARAVFQTALNQQDDLEAHLALGRLELSTESGPASGNLAALEALAALRLEPGSPRGRDLLASARARELAECIPDPSHWSGDDASAFYQLATQLARLTANAPDLADLAGDATVAAADFDQPLLVTVMGEFSSGKSTFVNAFIGAEVAPTGITPTTATINIVKYGRERGGRILYHDGRIETLTWEGLFPALRDLDATRAREVRLAEILLPLEPLERINIVDTPGLNSILPEHEQVARDFIARADAVVWLFTANQAGKASERAALQRIRDEGVRVLGVLNKQDQLDAGQVDQVLDHVSGELEGLVELVVPLSARNALSFRRDHDEEDGNWPALAAALEQRFFARAREIKRQACDRRLTGLIARARAKLEPHRAAAAGAAADLRQTAAAMRDAGDEFADKVVARERRSLSGEISELLRHAAREVLELVRPRRLPFGSHTATPADRDYLISLLDAGYEAALEKSRRATAASLREHGGAAASAIARAIGVVGNQAMSDLGRTSEDAVRLVSAQVFARCRAYLRGYVRGGYVDRFFERDLPKLELDEDSVYHALFRDAPDLDVEIARPLLDSGSRALATLADRLDHWAGVAEVMGYDVEVGVTRALDAIDEARRGLHA